MTAIQDRTHALMGRAGTAVDEMLTAIVASKAARILGEAIDDSRQAQIKANELRKQTPAPADNPPE